MSVGLINGLPGHPFFVHGAVVLVPLTALALVVCALWPSAARRLTWVLPALGLVTLVLVVLTTESGEWLEERVKETALTEEHTEMGSDLTPWAIALFVMTIVVWLLGRAARRRGREHGGAAESPAEGRASAVARLVSSVPVRVAALVIALAVAVGAVIEVYWIGESGARAVWHDVLSTSGSGGRE
ncbi:hypothetical protein NGF19_28365 [Streptomyces sp. RY43-2]|uniref:Integral membrane protein n=1 Tax=Streptomyces macrolidinus TaxID=2952607 RepID=A0ABT0ZM89_9ACTN|nr:DUF2231 domain-containing protein [Streptomyces macrolidinus]MCN9244650.1 hypothetical protein [Streptomyces macrolidinus]